MFSFSSNINTRIDYMCIVQEHLWSDLTSPSAAFLQVTKNFIIGILGPSKQHFVNICMYFIPTHIKHMLKWNFVLWCILSVSSRCRSRSQYNWISRKPWPDHRALISGQSPSYDQHIFSKLNILPHAYVPDLRHVWVLAGLFAYAPGIHRLDYFSNSVSLDLWPDCFPENFKRNSHVVRHFSLNWVSFNEWEVFSYE